MIFSLAIVLALSVAGSRWRLSQGTPVYEECRTPSCLRIARALVDSMDTSVDPCHDFYQYVCGGWIEKHPIPDDKSRYMGFDVLRDETSEKIRNSLKEVNNQTHPQAVSDAASLYRGCTDEETRQSKGLHPLRNVINKIGGWPMAESEGKSKDFEWQKLVAEVLRSYGITPIISLGVDVDANRTSQHIIYMDQPKFGLGRNQLVHSADEKNMRIVMAYTDFITSAAKILNPKAKTDALKSDASNIIDFEMKLAQLSTPSEERRKAKSWYNKMTVGEVQEKTENEYFQWTDFLNAVFKDYQEITPETELIVSNPEYVKNVIRLANNTDSRIVRNYIVWRVVSTFGHHTNREFRKIKFDFDKEVTGIKKEEKLERSCTDLVVQLMGFAVGRQYVDNYFPEKEKKDVEDLVEDARMAYRLSLRKNDWMDESTTDKSLEKLRSMIKLMGYPPWILNDDKLNKRYENVKGLDSNEFFFSFLRARKAGIDHIFGKLNQPTNRTHEWRTSPPVVNAFYDPSANTITFPAAILNPPYYGYDRPPALNFGALGQVIGHEMSHGFDDQGSEFGPDGNLINWWTKEARDKFNEKADCFRQQYSSYVEPKTNMNLNGNNTVGENIADNGGLRNAFIAYKMHRFHAQNKGERKDLRLPGISATPDQLFFIGFATTHCGSERTESLALTIQYDTHSPSEFRVLVPLGNLEEFAEAFDCPLGSRMNPETKCNLW